MLAPLENADSLVFVIEEPSGFYAASDCSVFDGIDLVRNRLLEMCTVMILANDAYVCLHLSLPIVVVPFRSTFQAP